MISQEVGMYKNMAASANINPTSGILIGFYVNSTSSGTIILYDSATTTTTTVISGTITPAIGFHRFPVAYSAGLYAVIGGTLNVTFSFG